MAMKRFFNPDNWLWKGFGRLADYFMISILWLVCCIPVVTIGSSTIAMYDTIAHCIRLHEGNLFRRFFSTLKNELLRGCLLTVLFAAVGFLLNAGYQILVQLSQGSQAMTVVSIVYFCSLIIPLGCGCWCVALQSRFVYPFGALLKNSFAFTFAYLPRTVAIVAVFVLVLNLCMNFPFFLMVAPAAAGHLQSVFIEKVFKQYMPQEEAEPEAEEAEET